jgi:hypothetical protein
MNSTVVNLKNIHRHSQRYSKTLLLMYACVKHHQIIKIHIKNYAF